VMEVPVPTMEDSPFTLTAMPVVLGPDKVVMTAEGA